MERLIEYESTVEVVTTSHPALSVITRLFGEFHKRQIRYCHWKAHGAHLIASVTGDSDLDILFDVNQKEEIEFILAALGFKEFEAIKQKRIEGIVDFLGLDTLSGKLIHLHAHYKLPMGALYLKEYQPDLEELILENRVFNNAYGTYCIHPVIQFVLLFLMESLKLRHRDALAIRIRNKVQCNEKTLSEYRWLKERVMHAKVQSILQILFKNPSPIEKILNQDINRKQLLKLAALVKTEFSEKQLFPTVQGVLIRWFREVTAIINKRAARWWPIPAKRTNPRGGVAIAVIGADGSGKSTAISDLKKTFEGKLDVCPIYFGRGDGKVSWTRRQLQSFKEMLFPEKKIRIKNQGHGSSHKQEGLLSITYKCINAILVAREKSKNLKRMQAAKKRGMLVIGDRYPQNQIMGFNDGPLLYSLKNSGNPLFRICARYEAKIYARAEEAPPEIVFKLIADAGVVEKRKPGETSLEKLEAKINGIKQLRFKDPCQVITVDATKPLPEVLTIIKKEIWNAM
jgi:thymidylate kinase